MKRAGPESCGHDGGPALGRRSFLASFSAHRLWWLYLTYGVIGGIGLGMGYVVPIAVLVKWFPDRRGLITGIAVAGFGAGSLFSAPAAGWLMLRVGLMPTFAYLGVAYGIIAIAAGLVHEESARRLEAGGLDPVGHANFAAFRPRLHAGPGAGHMAVVGDQRPDVDQHDGGSVDRLPGVSDFSGVGKRHASRRQPDSSESSALAMARENFLVLDFRSDDEENAYFS